MINYNTLTKQKETLKTIEENKVKIILCGLLYIQLHPYR